MKVLHNTKPAESLKDMVCEGCGNADPDCEGIFLRPRCHPNAPVRVAYLNAHHALAVSCSKCERPVVTLRLDGPKSAVLQ